MKRIIITVAAALLTAVPVTIGLVGNTSFAQSVPVHVPSQASVLDDKGGLTTHVEPGDDKGDLTTHIASGDDKSGTSRSAKDDNGGHGGDTNSTTTNGGEDDGPKHP